MKLPTIEELLKAGVHFGHKTSKWHPSMGDFIFGERREIHIINLRKTLKCLEESLQFITQTVSQKGVVLIIGTKKQVQKKVKEIAEETGMPYVNAKWIGGTVTNWPIIKRQITKLKKAREEKERGEWQKYTKKERVMLQRELDRLIEKYAGIESLEKPPEVLFIVDCKESKTVLREARLKSIPIVALCDTNVDVRKIDHPIPSNDDAVKSLNLMLDLLKQAILEGKEKVSNESQSN